ncbi:MAG: ribE [Gammaproteobacteria bacterium]|jgi:riboflavin synthase|nr:ribE [Gammaproteobacteria bacterium]
MFSGYISDCGYLKEIKKTAQGVRFCITSTYERLERGESIAVDGACLTVTDILQDSFFCDLSPETLACTRAGRLVEGDRVNLERSICLNDRLNGHLVTGHVDQTCLLKKKNVLSEYTQLSFSGVHLEAFAFIVPKGSVAINGVSLTLNNVEKDVFDIMLIPETLAKTNLSELEAGDYVNVEFDYFAKLVAKQTKLYLGLS